MGHDTARGTRHPVHGCLPRPRRAHPLGRLVQHPTRRPTRRSTRGAEGARRGLARQHPRRQPLLLDYVEKEWLPNKHVEASRRAAYISYLDKHFFPFFGHRGLNRISPSLVQDWVTQAKADGLAPRSIRKYHVFLSSVFVRAVKDRVLVYNPCDHTELPKVIAPKARTLTPTSTSVSWPRSLPSIG